MFRIDFGDYIRAVLLRGECHPHRLFFREVGVGGIASARMGVCWALVKTAY